MNDNDNERWQQLSDGNMRIRVPRCCMAGPAPVPPAGFELRWVACSHGTTAYTAVRN